ncbi:methyltransferase domain-containing protein [Marinobacterium aestuariivivens]|uniref:Methyltransferase domain-containing protein n=1 Tax=Marinobacterium aestuariivivens TaxID=1698799 RepID=A0ABW2A9I0_9GAMM
MNETGYRIDKRKVADSFSQAASTYDNVARLQQEVGEELLLTIPEGTFERVLDLGCGTGYFTQQLTRLAGRPEVLGLDLAPGMLHYARQQYSHLPIQWVGGDAEQLPLADRSVDLVFSSLAI